MQLDYFSSDHAEPVGTTTPRCAAWRITAWAASGVRAYRTSRASRFAEVSSIASATSYCQSVFPVPFGMASTASIRACHSACQSASVATGRALRRGVGRGDCRFASPVSR